jgi:hypothetical protein
MTHDLAVAALLKTYSDLQGELAALRKKDAELCRQLDHVRGVLAIYRPEMDLKPISPTRPQKPRKVTPRGKQSTLALEVLKAATTPLTTREVAREVLKRQGQEEPDERLIGIVVPNVHGALARFKKRGTVKENGNPKRWEIVG